MSGFVGVDGPCTEVCVVNVAAGSHGQAVGSLGGGPNAGADEFDGGAIVFRALVVARGGASEVFDTVEEALDEIALPVEPA